jgi:alkanesulfonate monooxygenase SsuD/methylene tetrahydromethanopterin reductase-like flavin-dependent oxidoreductase (luciferase family)
MTGTVAPFRFGVVAPIMSGLAQWREQIRRIAGQGYSTLLMPDVPGWQPAPAPTLAIAATLTDLRVGTWVYASPLRPAWQVAQEAHSLTDLTDGRFDLGIGTGRPGIDDLVRELGLPPVSGPERLARVRDAIAELRRLDGPDRRTPVIMAVRGPKARALAAEAADIITIGMMPGDTREQIEEVARDIRATSDAPLALHVSIVGDTKAPFMAGPDAVPAEFRAARSLAYLPADPAAAADELLQRREECGFSYIVFGSNCADAMAPVVAQLSGQ